MELITMVKGKVNVKVANTEYVKQFYNGLGYKVIDNNIYKDKTSNKVTSDKEKQTKKQTKKQTTTKKKTTTTK